MKQFNLIQLQYEFTFWNEIKLLHIQQIQQLQSADYLFGYYYDLYYF